MRRINKKEENAHTEQKPSSNSRIYHSSSLPTAMVGNSVIGGKHRQQLLRTDCGQLAYDGTFPRPPRLYSSVSYCTPAFHHIT